MKFEPETVARALRKSWSTRIDGVRYDFTAGQFDAPIEYVDTTAVRTDAELGATSAERQALRSAFMRHFGHSG